MDTKCSSLCIYEQIGENYIYKVILLMLKFDSCMNQFRFHKRSKLRSYLLAMVLRFIRNKKNNNFLRKGESF